LRTAVTHGGIDVLEERSLHAESRFKLVIQLTDIVQHIAQRSLLKRIDAQAIVLLHLNPSAHILALIILTCGQPLSRVAVTLLTVAGSANGKKLRTCQATRVSTCYERYFTAVEYLLVGKLLAASVGPGACAGDPGFFLEWS